MTQNIEVRNRQHIYNGNQSKVIKKTQQNDMKKTCFTHTHKSHLKSVTVFDIFIAPITFEIVCLVQDNTSIFKQSTASEFFSSDANWNRDDSSSFSC